MLSGVNNNRNQVQFGAVKINKPFEKWNEDVLNATLHSRFIRNIIAADAKNGKDTYLTHDLIKRTNKGTKSSVTVDEMILNIKGAGKDLMFSAKALTKSFKAGLFGKDEVKISGSHNLGQDIADQVKAFDNETFSRKQAIKEIKDLAGGIEVTEKV